jgi:hypothetical protein
MEEKKGADAELNSLVSRVLAREFIARMWGAKFICAEFETCKVFKNVSVKIPKCHKKDKRGKPVKGFTTVTLSPKKGRSVVSKIQDYYRFGLKTDDGVLVTRNFFNLEEKYYNQWVVADVKVIHKVDELKGVDSLILDIIVTDQKISDWKLLGISNEGQINIPYSKQFISFEKIEKIEKLVVIKKQKPILVKKNKFQEAC